jgi:phosphoenolpyruvate carboxylase
MIKLFLLAFLFLGCGVNQYTATTKASYENGNWYWLSNKNQENLKAKLGKDRDGNPIFEIETTATTPEAAIAAAMQSFALVQQQFAELLKQLGPLLKAGALAGS